MSAVVPLSTDLVVGALGELHTQLVERLEAGGPVALDASAVTTIDTAGAQLLAAFCRDARAAGQSVGWEGDTAPVRAVAGTLGLSSLLFPAGGAA